MSDFLDMSLDEIMKRRKETEDAAGSSRDPVQSHNRGHRHHRSEGNRILTPNTGPTRRFSNRGGARMTPYPVPHELLRLPREMQGLPMTEMLSGRSMFQEGTKIYISNLHCRVSENDIRTLFSDVSFLITYSIHYDRSGISKGTAEVVFARHSDALVAIERFNNVELDGKPLKIEPVGVNPLTPVPSPNNDNFGNQKQTLQSLVISSDWNNREGSRGYGRRRSQVRDQQEPLSAEALDTDLDKYRSERP